MNAELVDVPQDGTQFVNMTVSAAYEPMPPSIQLHNSPLGADNGTGSTQGVPVMVHESSSALSD